MEVTAEEMANLQAYLTKKLQCQGLTLKKRERAEDSVELLVNGEFFGVVYKDTEDGDTSFNINICVLDIDIK